MGAQVQGEGGGKEERNRKREEIRGRAGDGVELEGREESRGEAKV